MLANSTIFYSVTFIFLLYVNIANGAAPGDVLNSGKTDQLSPFIEFYESVSLSVPKDTSYVDIPTASEQEDDTHKGSNSSYMDDVRAAIKGERTIDPKKSYFVRAILPVGELLVLTTANGCALLSDPEGAETGKTEALEFSFRIADLEDCEKLTDIILEGLQSEIADEWDKISMSERAASPISDSVQSRTTLREIGVRDIRNTLKGIDKDACEQPETEYSKESDSSVRDMAAAFLAKNLLVDIITTDSEGVCVLHFDLVEPGSNREMRYPLGSAYSEELKALADVLSVVNGALKESTAEDLKKLEEDFMITLEKAKDQLSHEITLGHGILDDLSKHGVSNVECTGLSGEDCSSVSKCELVNLNGKSTCFVSSRTIFWLLETGCGLQSKAALLSIIRDLVAVGLLSEGNYQTLRQSFDLSHICNAIVHTYMSADISEVNGDEVGGAFGL